MKNGNDLLWAPIQISQLESNSIEFEFELEIEIRNSNVDVDSAHCELAFHSISLNDINSIV